MNKFIYAMISILLLMLTWQLYAAYVGNPLFFPYPADVFSQLGALLKSAQTYAIIGNSFFRLTIALFIACFIGILFGLLAGVIDAINYLLYPIVTSLRTLPVASIIIIILIVFGNVLSIYIITFLMLFPIVFEATRQGVLNLDPNLKAVLRLEDSRLIYSILKVYLPCAKPYIKTGIIQSVGLGFKVLVMAEFIAQSPQSIGQALFIGKTHLDHALIFAWTLLLIAMVWILEFGLSRIKSHE